MKSFNVDFFSWGIRSVNFFNRLFSQRRWQLEGLISSCHSVKVAFGTMSVSTHTTKAKPVSDFCILRNFKVVADHVHSIASHSKNNWKFLLTELSNLTAFDLWVELVRVIKRNSVHQHAVKAVIDWVVHVEARLSALDSHSDNSGNHIEAPWRHVTARLSNNSVTQGVVFSLLERVDCALR